MSGIFPFKILWCTLPSKVMSLYPGNNVVLRPHQRRSLVQCIMGNSEALSWSHCKKKCPQSAQPQTGLDVVITPQQAKTQAGVTARRGCKKIVRARGRGGLEWISDFWVWSVLPAQGQGGLQPPVEWRAAIDCWWLPGKGESVLSKDVAPGRSIKSQWVSLYGQHKLDLNYKKRNKKKQGEDAKLGSSKGWIFVGLDLYACMKFSKDYKILYQSIWCYCFSGLNYSPPNSSGETVAPHVTVRGGRAFMGGIKGIKGVLVNSASTPQELRSFKKRKSSLRECLHQTEL